MFPPLRGTSCAVEVLELRGGMGWAGCTLAFPSAPTEGGRHGRDGGLRCMLRRRCCVGVVERLRIVRAQRGSALY